MRGLWTLLALLAASGCYTARTGYFGVVADSPKQLGIEVEEVGLFDRTDCGHYFSVPRVGTVLQDALEEAGGDFAVNVSASVTNYDLLGGITFGFIAWGAPQ